jgi:hypothetical protein
VKSKADLKTNELEALRLLGASTRNWFQIYDLAGPSNAVTRAKLMTMLTGVKTPQAKAGVTALSQAFVTLSGVTGSCNAAVENNFTAWAKEMVSA